jgi:hypothetical protein
VEPTRQAAGLKLTRDAEIGLTNKASMDQQGKQQFVWYQQGKQHLVWTSKASSNWSRTYKASMDQQGKQQLVSNQQGKQQLV